VKGAVFFVETFWSFVSQFS